VIIAVNGADSLLTVNLPVVNQPTGNVPNHAIPFPADYARRLQRIHHFTPRNSMCFFAIAYTP
jgi:hypothetical protein